MPEFVHLHLHSQYSLLDGAIKVKDLLKRTKEFGVSTVAITDHGNMYGAVDFFKKARAEGVKPIFGVEGYVSKGDHREKERGAYHLVLLAKDLTGYRNLCKLVSIAHIEGFYYHPRFSIEALRKYSEGVIGLSACLGGEVAQTILNQGEEAAEEVIAKYRDSFAPGDYYLEVQPNGMPEQIKVNQALRRLATKMNLPMVATNDCHYLEQKHAKAHDILMCIQTGKTLDDESRMHHEVDAYWLKPPEVMWQELGDEFPDALENTVKIAERCNVEIPIGTYYLPNYIVPEGMTIDEYLIKRARDGLQARYAEFDAINKVVDRDLYNARLERELKVVVSMGFPGYFLIVQDFINWAKDHHIPVGPGRGSGAGSLVAYSLRITDLDPIPYNLLFERFLNPERISMPDFDVDFCMNRRTEVIDYVSRKYGKDHVGQIATFGSLKARGVIKDVGRVLGMSFQDTDKLAKLVPEGPKVTLDLALEQEPRLRAIYDEDEKVKELIDYARTLEGLLKSPGMHAAGVVIGQQSLENYCPLWVGKNGELVTQYAKEEVEDVGLVKFDFLGLKTLTVIDDAVQLINRHLPPDKQVNLAKLSMDDPEVYGLISRGDTEGVFQLESSGFQELLRKLKPDIFEDIIAAVALYRPGPLDSGMLDDFIACKHGRQEIRYPHPCLEPILSETYGMIVYQEQVMQISQVMAGYSLGGADLLRRAMGKKKVEVMEKQRAVFEAGAKEKGIDPQIAADVFELMSKFAAYGFNKSHSAAYALLTYQTAWLKHYHKAEFMAALLTCDKDCADKLTKGIRNARNIGIKVLPPSVNQSLADFDVVNGNILFGMAGVKGVGLCAVEAIVEARQSGPFTTFFDFCERVDLKRVNKKTIDSLIKAGAFDEFGHPRARLCAGIDFAVEHAAQSQRDRESGQASLFSLFDSSASTETSFPPEILEIPEWPQPVCLANEKGSLGFYVSGHPLDRFGEQIERFSNCTVEGLEDKAQGDLVLLAGIQTSARIIPLKSGKGRFGIFRFEDMTGETEITAMGEELDTYEELLCSDEPLLVTGTVQRKEEEEKTIISVRLGRGRRWQRGRDHQPEPASDEPLVVSLSHLLATRSRGVSVTVKSELVTEARLVALRDVLTQHAGNTAVSLTIHTDDDCDVAMSLPQYRVAASDDLRFAIDRVFGGECEQRIF